MDNTRNWSLKVASLNYRCSLEAGNKRTVERSMMQMEYLIHELKNTKVPVTNRMDLFFASGLKPIWDLEEMWAKLMLSLGLVKGALDVFLKISLWEEVIMCYNILELKHKVNIFLPCCIFFHTGKEQIYIVYNFRRRKLFVKK